MLRSPHTLALLFASVAGLLAQSAVWTAHYDNLRTGANVSETILTPANVNPAQFGKLASLPVSGCVVAQPLYVPNVPADGRRRNLLLVATTTNAVYAFDADDDSLYFAAQFGIAAPSTDFVPGRHYHDFPDCDAGSGDGPIGIVGTPVIDVANLAMYFVANTIDNYDEPHQHRHILHKISVSTGADMEPPVEIQGTYAGIPFQSRYQLQRSALLLANGRVYVTFASHQDEAPYYGWMFAYDSGLRQVGIANFSPQKMGAGIWQSGGGPAYDGRRIYVNTGNLAWDDADPTDNSDSILQIDPDTLDITAKTSFYPESNNWDKDFDLDLGSSRVILIPDSNYAVSGSKFGDVFIVNRTGMSLEARQQVAARHSAGIDWTGIYNGFAYWNGIVYAWPGGGGFFWGPESPFPVDTLKGYSIAPDYSHLTALADGQSDQVGLGYQGANIAISANGNDPASGILWATMPARNSKLLQPGYLKAYHASDFSSGVFQELWSNIDPEHPEETFHFAKFSQPLVANGKVFLPTFSGQVVVYGLTGAAPF
jgi:hypothetical protein